MSHMKNRQIGRERMPQTIVKIIGSKYVRFPAEKPKECPDVGSATSLAQKILGRIRDTESFRQCLQGGDRSSSGLLSVSEFQGICASHGASVTLSSLLPLLEDAAFSDQGQIRWKQIVDLLQERKEVKLQEEEETVPEDGAPHSTEEEGTTQSDYEGLSEIQTAGRPCAASRGAAPRDTRPVSEPPLHLWEPDRSEGEESWIERFMKMENVLQMCQIKDTGLVAVERARQVINKYNIIYTLCLSPDKISEALDMFCSGGHILLAPVLHFLKEL
ncbi:uncharacterized protein C1orf87 homolog [Engystomops pustulosus]|uniref:uncharacterized protein C1orf87 homolog n=1 Tax=Engystomops pustulosus TaxID=76066 RepID=UPI003AFAF44A